MYIPLYIFYSHSQAIQQELCLGYLANNTSHILPRLQPLNFIEFCSSCYSVRIALQGPVWNRVGGMVVPELGDTYWCNYIYICKCIEMMARNIRRVFFLLSNAYIYIYSFLNVGVVVLSGSGESLLWRNYSPKAEYRLCSNRFQGVNPTCDKLRNQEQALCLWKKCFHMTFFCQLQT